MTTLVPGDSRRIRRRSAWPSTRGMQTSQIAEIEDVIREGVDRGGAVARLGDPVPGAPQRVDDGLAHLRVVVGNQYIQHGLLARVASVGRPVCRKPRANCRARLSAAAA